MLETPLSKREWSLYKELKQKLKDNNSLEFDLATYHKYEDWLILLKDKGVIWEVFADGAYLCGTASEFDEFEAWIKDLDKKSKKLNRRDWTIAIVSAIIGALIGLIPSIIQLLS